MHFRVEISLTDRQIKFAGRVETNLIIEGVNNDDVKHNVVLIIQDRAFVEVIAQTIKGFTVVIAKSRTALTAVKRIAIAADQR